MNEFEMLIQQCGWSVPQAAKALGYSEGNIYRWKRGAEIPRASVMTLLKMQLKEMQLKAIQSNESDMEFRFIDLFAGIGGLRKAMEGAGGKCVFTSEWDRFAQATYNANFPDNRSIAGDIRDVGAADIRGY